MWAWLIRAGASAAPYAYGWVSHDLWNWFDDSEPEQSEAYEYGIAGWGLSTIMLAVIGYLLWDKWGK